jgi:lysophospholipase L1-like esterase
MQHQTTPTYTYLALGDSYTIGESILQADNFPNQVVTILKGEGLSFHPPRIIAKTGWTTDELEEGITSAKQNGLLLPVYHFVSLLIGVNDQYRERNIEDYKTAFELLLQKSISLAGGKKEKVAVLSIPDWGVTPYANGRDREKIATEIDAYNTLNKKIAQQYHVHYINITPWTKEAADDNTLLAPDGLHPSGKEYKRWAEKLVDFIKKQLAIL